MKSLSINKLVLLLVISGICLLLTGCGPSRTLKNPAKFPEDYRGRRLYNTPTAFIYASSSSAAGEAERLAAKVAEQYQKCTDTTPGKALLIVTDNQDQTLLNDPDSFLSLYLILTPDAEIMKDIEKDATENLNGEGITADDIIKLSPLPLHKNVCWLRDFPTTVYPEISWAALVPTKSAMKKTMDTMLKQQMKEQDMSLAEKTIMFTMWPIIESMTNKALTAQREIQLLITAIQTSAEISPSEKDKLIRKIESEGEKQMEKDLDTEKMKKQAQQTASSQDNI